MQQDLSVKEFRSVHEIASLAKGGVTEMAYKLGCQTRTIEGWAKRGIHDRYWKPLQKLYGITPYQCFKFNARIKGYRA